MIISIMSRKGGCGKSTLSCNLSAFLAGKGYKVALMDADPQGSSTEWTRVRQEKGVTPSITHHVITEGFEVLDGYDFVVIDGKGEDGIHNRKAMLISDLIVVPLKPSQADLDTIPYMKSILEVVKSKNDEVIVRWVINESPTNTKIEVKQAFSYFEAFDLKAIPSVIHARKAYRDCLSVGKGITEFTDGKAIEEFIAVLSDIFNNAKHSHFILSEANLS